MIKGSLAEKHFSKDKFITMLENKVKLDGRIRLLLSFWLKKADKLFLTSSILLSLAKQFLSKNGKQNLRRNQKLKLLANTSQIVLLTTFVIAIQNTMTIKKIN